MTTDTTPAVGHQLARPIMYAGVLAVVWMAAVALRPDMTYHLAPLIVAGTPAAVTALDSSDAGSRRTLGWATLLGFVLAVVLTIVLAVTGRLDGPAFEPFANAAAESIVAAAVGAAGGFLFGVSKRS